MELQNSVQALSYWEQPENRAALETGARFLRGRHQAWADHQRRQGKPELSREAAELLCGARATTAATLLRILAKNPRAYARATNDIEAGVFSRKYKGFVQYLLWWVDSWYPAQPVTLRNETKLRIGGYSRFFDKTFDPKDARLRRQLVLLKTQEHLTCGCFPRVGDYVKVLLVDDFEAPYFLCEDAFTELGQRRHIPESNTGWRSPSRCSGYTWAPVGKVVRSLPLHDQAEVDVAFLCSTDRVRVNNIYMLPIEEAEYHDELERIMRSRRQGLSVIENILCRGEPRLLSRVALPVAEQRCILSYWDCYSSIGLTVYNIRLSQEYTLRFDDDVLRVIGLFGPYDRLPDLTLQQKEDLCKQLPAHLGVERGEVFVCVPPHDQDAGNQGTERPTQPPTARQVGPEELLWARGKLAGVDVEVAMDALDDHNIRIYVTEFISPAHRRYHTLTQLHVQQWRRLGFPDLKWLRDDHRRDLTRRLLKHLRPHEGVPALDVLGELCLPVEFEPFLVPSTDELKAAQMSSTHHHTACTRAAAQSGVDVRWRWARRLPITDNDDGSTAACRGRFMVTARVCESGQLGFTAFSQAKGQEMSLSVSVADWHGLGYGPLQWCSEAQQGFLASAVCDRLRVSGDRLIFTPVLTTRITPSETQRLPGAISVEDHGSFMLCVCGEQSVKICAQDMEAACGIKVQHLKWLNHSLRSHVAIRLGRLAKGMDSGEMEVKTGPLVVWRAVQRKRRLGDGPLLATVYDMGHGIVIDTRDFKGEHVERVAVDMQRVHQFAGREVWPTVMEDDTRERVLRPILLSVGRPAPISHFDHFLSLRPRADAERIAAIQYFQPVLVTSEDQVVEHLKSLRPDPTKLRPKELELLLRLKTMVDDELRIRGASDRMKRVMERVHRATKGTHVSLSVFYRPPKPPSRLCECCSEEKHPGHGRVCTHQFGLCRVCVIQAHSRMIVQKLPYLREAVAGILHKLRPKVELDGATWRLRKRLWVRERQEKMRVEQEREATLYTHVNEYWLGVEVEMPKRVKKRRKKEHSDLQQAPEHAQQDEQSQDSVTTATESSSRFIPVDAKARAAEVGAQYEDEDGGQSNEGQEMANGLRPVLQRSSSPLIVAEEVQSVETEVEARKAAAEVLEQIVTSLEGDYRLEQHRPGLTRSSQEPATEQERLNTHGSATTTQEESQIRMRDSDDVVQVRHGIDDPDVLDGLLRNTVQQTLLTMVDQIADMVQLRLRAADPAGGAVNAAQVVIGSIQTTERLAQPKVQEIRAVVVQLLHQLTDHIEQQDEYVRAYEAWYYEQQAEVSHVLSNMVAFVEAEHSERHQLNERSRRQAFIAAQGAPPDVGGSADLGKGSDSFRRRLSEHITVGRQLDLGWEAQGYTFLEVVEYECNLCCRTIAAGELMITCLECDDVQLCRDCASQTERFAEIGHMASHAVTQTVCDGYTS